ncbi:Spy/CpxP family protein refolding chaperone [Thalassotalea marina]|uniref:Periplasmic heavy metal sensor n=1 Tax=Thalassotalea marina TaxID=1673741 RepID=A0A919BGI7_9GAMM|nr:Spy/CpxP family protein refolding chaperone [Thalassotalea marina]GHF87244.1 hypothetical protein GCM10017161_13460 [Thalassotalea marina]
MREITKTFVILLGLSLPLQVMNVNANPLLNEAGKSEVKKSHKKHRSMHKMARYLELSDEQKTKIKDIYQQAREDNVVYKESRQAYKTQLEQIMAAKDFDEEAFASLRQTYAVTFSEAALSRAKTKHAIYHTLTEEQREKLKSAKGKRRALLH